MFELLCIFTSGGLVLWNQGQCWTPLNVLISKVLLQSKTHKSQFEHENFILKWTLVPNLEIIIVAVYQQIFPLVLVDSLLESMRKAILKRPTTFPLIQFDEEFQQIYRKWTEKCKETQRAPEVTASLFTPEPKGQTTASPKKNKKDNNKPKKEQRTWDISTKITKKKIDALDKSRDRNPQTRVNTDYINDIVDSDSEEEQPSGLFARLASKMKNFTGNKQLTQADVAPVLRDFKDIMVTKNVAEQISEELCSSVGTSLIKTSTSSFTSVHETVKTSIMTAVQKLLTPSVQIDVLRDSLTAKARRKPYVVVFCGVNGVGKSTSLAKVGHFLKVKGGLSLMMAACDTFRSGAIEQIRTHANTLNVPLFEQGYGKEPSNVAKEAIKQAQKKGIEVVLVDTAGRMQHNDDLMQGLANLVSENKPDLVLFVGEALVGNDGVDQLVTFNKALIDRTVDGRGVDGVLLTKFDTVDDKVGATLSMVYSTGKPIVFVGVGERYGDLKRLNVNTVVNSLFR